MVITDPEEARALLALDVPAGRDRPLLDALVGARTLLRGHFALHRDRHSSAALRFRSVGRAPAALELVTTTLLDGCGWDLSGAKILSPESAGFFLADAIARRAGLPHAVAQTDVRRLPSKTLLTGDLRSGDRVILVNDVASTGTSLDALRVLVEESGAILDGILLFAVVGTGAGTGEFQRYCDRQRVRGHWIATSRWRTHAPGAGCPGCDANQPLIPIAEFN